MRYALPVNAQTCECYDFYGMKCSAWCTDVSLANQVHQLTLVGTVTTDSACPFGSKVIGCYLKPMLVAGINRYLFTNFYPSPDSCICTGNEGAWCVASCAVNVKYFDIISQPGLGKVLTTCKRPETSILGCGINASFIGSTSRPSAFVLNQTTCQCFADYSYKCFAFCGLLFDYA